MSLVSNNKPNEINILNQQNEMNNEMNKFAYSYSKSENDLSEVSWFPNTDRETLLARAQLLKQIREFFYSRDILEVETPLLCQTASLDPFIQAIPVHLATNLENSHYFLQTSPEFAMKRLLAAGSGSIFQLCKAFRDNELGRYHNPEFTMLEWYHLGIDHFQLMDEIDDLLSMTLDTPKSIRMSYQALFEKYLDVNPHTASIFILKQCAKDKGIHLLSEQGEEYNQKGEKPEIKENKQERDTWLNLLMSHFIEPMLGFEIPVMVYDYPESQAALAKKRAISEKISVAERFEVYICGIELANGYHELTDSKQQKVRFEEDINIRSRLGLQNIPLDMRLISALNAGLPYCSGVALGFDRLLMLKLKKEKISDVLAFTIEKA